MIVLLAAAAAGLVFTYYPSARFTYAVASAGPDSALLLTRRTTESQTRTFVERVSLADDGPRWTSEVTPLVPADSLGHTGALLAGTRVLVLASRPGDPGEAVVRALAADTGELIWETAVGPLRIDDAGRIGQMLFADVQRVYVAREIPDGDATAGRIDALDLASGAVQWTATEVDGRKLGYDAHVQLMDTGLLVSPSYLAPAVVLDGPTGNIIEKWDGQPLCEGPEGWVIYDAATVALQTGGEPTPLVVDGWRASPKPPCGTRDGDVIFSTEPRETPDVGLARFNTDGTLVWHLPLGHSEVEWEGIGVGALPRFVPVVAAGDADGEDGDETGTVVVVVDLDAGRVVSRASTAHYATALTAAGRAYVTFPTEQSMVVVDPETGALTRALRWPSGELEARPVEVMDGQLWVSGLEYALPGALPWAVVDLATAETVVANGEFQPTEVDVSTLLAPMEPAAVEQADRARDAWQQPADLVAALGLSPNDTVAVLDDGTGYLDRFLAAAVRPEGWVISLGLDPKTTWTRWERAWGDGTVEVEVRQAAPDDLKLRPNEADVVLVVGAWARLHDRVELFTAVRRDLRDGGRLVVVDFQGADVPLDPAPELVPVETVEAELAEAGWTPAGSPLELPHQFVRTFTAQPPE